NVIPHGQVDIVNGKVEYTPDHDYSGPDSFRYTITDGTLISTERAVSVTVTPVHDNPIANFDLARGREDSVAVTIHVLDNDTFGPDGGAALSVTGVTQGSKGHVAIVGLGTAVSYRPFHNLFGLDSFTYTISDGAGGSATASVFINVTAVNDAPVNSVPGTQVTATNQMLGFAAARGNQVSIADVDALAVRVTLTAANGVLSLSSTKGLTFLAGDGSKDSSMSFTGTIANINAALDGMYFVPTFEYSGGAGLTISTDDQGESGIGGPLNDTDTVLIYVGSVPL
ncbi:MAG TPA: Ig-like domain-containing protein, partial [Candidatus Limnocylindrales bacterium]